MSAQKLARGCFQQLYFLYFFFFGSLWFSRSSTGAFSTGRISTFACCLRINVQPFLALLWYFVLFISKWLASFFLKHTLEHVLPLSGAKKCYSNFYKGSKLSLFSNGKRITVVYVEYILLLCVYYIYTKHLYICKYVLLCITMAFSSYVITYKRIQSRPPLFWRDDC